MPGITDLPATFESGSPILAKHLQTVFQETRKASLLAGSFSSGLFSLTRPLGRARAGTDAIYGLLKETVAAGGIVQNAIDAHVLPGGIGPLEPLLDESLDPVEYAAYNPNSFTDCQIYLDPAASMSPIKVMVWGFPFQYNFGTEEEPDFQTCMMIWNPPTEPAMVEGYVKAPVNAVGQVFMHNNNSNKGIMSAGPCGGA